MKTRTWLWTAMLIVVWVAAGAGAAEKPRKILLIGGPSSGSTPGENDYDSGVLLLQHCLNQVRGVTAVASIQGWPTDAKAFQGAASVVFHFGGGAKHPIVSLDRMKTFGKLMNRGVGFACIGGALEVPRTQGGEEFKHWLGAFFEDDYSFAPVWDAEIRTLPIHPVCSGVKPFVLKDEWRFNLRFRDRMTGITPILYAKPSDETRRSKPGPPHIREHAGRPEVLAWTCDRLDGGRAFGLSGGRFHRNWADPDFRKLVLNAIVWTAKVEIPREGVVTQVSEKDLELAAPAK